MGVLSVLSLFLAVAWTYGDYYEYPSYEECDIGFWSVDGSGYAPCEECTKCDIFYKECTSWKDAVCMTGCEKTCQNGGTIVGEENMLCTCTCAQDYYGEECEIHNPHTDSQEFVMTDKPSGIGKMGNKKCITSCPFWKSEFYKQDGPYRCRYTNKWKDEFCLLCGAAGMDLIDQNTGKQITEYCETRTCEQQLVITDDHVDKSKEKGQTFGFDPECADRFFQANFGSTKWSGKGIDLNYDEKDEYEAGQIWFWNAKKRKQECGKKACARYGRSKSKPGDFKIGHAIQPIATDTDWWCDGKISVWGNYPGLYKKSGQYFELYEKCMDKFYGSSDWDTKVLTVSRGSEESKQFKVKLFRNSRFFGGKSVGRLHPLSKVKKDYWKVNDDLYAHAPCEGHFGECNSVCLKKYEITKRAKGKGFCPHEKGDVIPCESGEGACIKSCGCEGQSNPLYFVCGADGNSYRNKCQAECVGTTVANYGPCKCRIVKDAWEEEIYGEMDPSDMNCKWLGCLPGLECMDGKCYACPREHVDISDEGVAVGGLNISSMANNMALIALGCTMLAGGYYMAVKNNADAASYQIL